MYCRKQVKQIRELFSDIFFGGSRYIVLEVLNHCIQATVLKANFEKKKVLVTNNFLRHVSDFGSDNVLKEIRGLLKKISRPEKYKYIISLDSRFATTVFASVSLVRPHPKEVIDEADLDNLISQAIWRFFDRNRPKVAQKMNIDEVDVLLSDVKIRGVKLDGHKVVNPIGFKSKAVEVYFSQTFIARELMRELREIVPQDRICFITETGPAMAHVLSRALEKDKFFIANLFPNQTSIVSASSGHLSHHDDFDWGEKNLTHLLERYFRVDPVVAKTMIGSYIQSNTSQDFLRRFENILVKELQIFANGLESLVDDESDIYINPFFDVPPIIYSSRFRDRFQKSLKLLPLSTNIIIEKLGYDVQYKSSADIKNSLSVISILLEASFIPQNDKVGHLANRRVRWLIT